MNKIGKSGCVNIQPINTAMITMQINGGFYKFAKFDTRTIFERALFNLC